MESFMLYNNSSRLINDLGRYKLNGITCVRIDVNRLINDLSSKGVRTLTAHSTPLDRTPSY